VLVVDRRLKLVLVYEWPHGEILIAEVRDPALLLQAKEGALETAERELRLVSRMDPVIRIDKQCDLRKKARMLNYLIREDDRRSETSRRSH